MVSILAWFVCFFGAQEYVAIVEAFALHISARVAFGIMAHGDYTVPFIT